MSDSQTTAGEWVLWRLQPAKLRQRIFAAWSIFCCKDAVIVANKGLDQWLHCGTISQQNVEQAKKCVEALNAE